MLNFRYQHAHRRTSVCRVGCTDRPELHSTFNIHNSPFNCLRRPIRNVLIVGLSVLTLAATSDVSISPNVAALYVGERKLVEGSVTTAERDGATVHLHLGTKPPELVVSLIIGLLSHFPPEPDHYYAGKTVRVVGTIRSFRGRPQIVIHDPADIEVVGEAPPTPVRAAAGAATEVQQLRERVRQLEQRVRELE